MKHNSGRCIHSFIIHTYSRRMQTAHQKPVNRQSETLISRLGRSLHSPFQALLILLQSKHRVCARARSRSLKGRQLSHLKST